MAFNPGSPQPIQPLSLGNVVSAGLRLYRSHLKQYLKLSFLAYAWFFIPVYGWAKCTSIIASISRLAFAELIDQPESVEAANRVVDERKWQFLLMTFLMLLIGIALGVAIIIPFAFLIGLVTAITVNSSGVAPNPFLILTLAVLIFLSIPLFVVILLWLQARLLVVEVPLAIEDNVDGSSTISRSWELTKGNVWRIVAILFVGYLITLPIQLPFSLLSNISQRYFQPLIRRDVSYAFVSFLVSLTINLFSAALVVPFWQAIKAVIYYDLRSRREGFGLKLRDRD